MTATTKGFDAVLVVHVLLAITALVVLVVLRAAAAAVARGGVPPASALRSFTGRTELAGRVVHLVPLTGLALLGLSRGVYGPTTPFVVVGLMAWAGAAASLEAVAFPAQRAVAAALGDRSAASPGARRAAARMQRATELAALCLVAAGIAMVAGPIA